VAATPHHVAVRCEAGRYPAFREVTYGKLDEQARRVAKVIKEKKGGSSIVALMGDSSLEMITGILGILKAGCAYLPIAPGYPEERKKYMLKDSRVEILLTDNDYCGDFAGHTVNLKNVETSCVKPLRQGGSKEKSHRSRQAYIIYTSGSTGTPKGVVVEHRNVIRLVKNTAFLAFEKGDRILQTGALEFDASTLEIWGSLLNGLTLHLVNKERVLAPELFKESLTRNKITTIWLTSALFNRMEQADSDIFKGLKNLLVGGDVLSP
ncbi:MAG: AMP-binding protein, partial [bacterium]|nr:AMP-binding protein [bacterium]